jgi:hypothetical protein
MHAHTRILRLLIFMAPDLDVRYSSRLILLAWVAAAAATTAHVAII